MLNIVLKSHNYVNVLIHMVAKTVQAFPIPFPPTLLSTVKTSHIIVCVNNIILDDVSMINFRVQKELMEQEKKKQETDAARRHAHAEEVRKQVREKEAERVMHRRAFFDEGIKLDQEARER